MLEGADNIPVDFVDTLLMSYRVLTNLLALPAVHVTGYQKEQDGIDIFVELEKHSETCPGCGVRSASKHSQKSLCLRDLPCLG